MKPFLFVLAAFLVVAFTAAGGAGQTLAPEDYAVEVNVASTWTYTGIYLFQGDTVLVHAKGTISTNGPGSDGWQNWFGPEGAAPAQPGGCTECPLPGFRTGALIARVGVEPAFFIGSFSAFVCETSGELQFGVNENQAEDNRGHLRAFVWRQDGPGPPTAARVSSLGTVALNDGIAISWEVYAEQGYRLYRREPGSPEITLNGENLEPSAQQYVDKTVKPGVEYEYALGIVFEGNSEIRSHWARITSAAPDLALHQNHPNPFNPTTKIGFSIPRKTLVRITIYDAAGRRIRLLVDSAYPAGLHSVQWDGCDDAGRKVSSGVYFYNLEANLTQLSRKMILLK
jgi:hypothetical protein